MRFLLIRNAGQFVFVRQCLGSFSSFKAVFSASSVFIGTGASLGRAALLLTVLASSLSAQDLAIRNVDVVDVKGGSVRADMNVVIRDGLIASIGGSSLPDGVQVLDGTGKFLIPGMWEMHAHVWESEPLFYLYIGAGVTGVRDTGSDIDRLKQWVTDVKAGRLIGPRVVASGAILDAPGPNRYPKLPVEHAATADEARSAVDRLYLSGSDFVKPLSRLSKEAYLAAAERARARGIVVAGHVPNDVSVREAVDAGQRSIEHLGTLPLACSSAESEIRQARAEATSRGDAAAQAQLRQRINDTFSESRCRTLFERMVRYGVWVTPTLSSGFVRNQIRSQQAQNNPNLKWIPEFLRHEWEQEYPATPAQPPSLEQLEQERKDAEFQRRLFALMRDTGVGILAGSDTGDPYVIPGFVVHDELRLLVEAGLSPVEALRAATLEPARYFGKEATQGSIDEGKIADLVMLDADPLADIRNVSHIHAVILGGKLLKRNQLDSLLASRK